MNITIHFSVAVLFSLLVYFLGSLLLSIFKEDNNFKLLPGILIKYATGLLSLLIIYAVFLTCFKTIYSTALLAVFIYLLLTKQRFNTFKNIGESLKKTIKKDYKTLLFLQGVLAVFILFQYISTGYILGIEYNAINEDISYYVTLAEYLNYTGIENKNTFYNEYLSTPISGIAPYHYFDLYLSGFLFKTVAFLNNMEIYNFIFLPFCYYLISLSFISTFSYFLKNKTFLILFLGILFTFFIGYFPANKVGLKGVEFLGSFGSAPFKYVPSYLFLSLFWIFYKQKRNSEIALIVSLLPTFSIIYLFHLPIAGLALFYFCYNQYKFQNTPSWFHAFKPLLISIATLLAIAIMYFILGESADSLLQPKESKIFSLSSIDLSLAKTITLYGIVKIALFFIVFYLIIFLTINKQIQFVKNNLSIFLTFGAILIWGIIGHALLQTNDEAWQLEDIFFMPITKITLAILVSSSIAYLLNKRKLLFFTFTTIPLLFALSTTIIGHTKTIKNNTYQYTYSTEFIESLKDYSHLFQKPGVILVDTTGFANSSMKARPALASHGGITKFITKRSAFFSISVAPLESLQTYKSTKIIKENINSPMGQHYLSGSVDTLTMQEAQLDFIQKNHINKILTHKNTKLDESLMKHVKFTFKDEKSNQVLYILHNN